jgi:acetyltransferase-like isoleucine patch superfamily enzyme
MEKSAIKERIERSGLKRCVLRLIMHPVKTRPRWWIRLFMRCYIKKGKGSVIYRSVRKDLPPFHAFRLGRYSVVESYSCINNAVGDLIIGDYTRVGIGNTIIGPVTIGNHVNLAQQVTVTALNHNYEDASKLMDEQGITTRPVVIEDDVWIGAGSIILPGVTIGRHAIVGAGSVVTHDVPPFTVSVGSPARVVKRYDESLQAWVAVKEK